MYDYSWVDYWETLQYVHQLNMYNNIKIILANENKMKQKCVL